MVKKRYDSFWKFLKEDDGDKSDPNATNPGWKKVTKKDEDEKEQEEVTKESLVKPEYPKTKESPGHPDITIPQSWYKKEEGGKAVSDESGTEPKKGGIISPIEYYLSRPFQEFFGLEGQGRSLEPAVESIKQSVDTFVKKIGMASQISNTIKSSKEFNVIFKPEVPVFEKGVVGLSLMDKGENLILFTTLEQFLQSGEEFESQERQFKVQTGDANKRTFRSLKESGIEFPGESKEDAQKRMNRANIERYEKWKRGERTYSDDAVKVAGEVLGKYGEAIFFIKKEMDDSLGDLKFTFSKFFTSWLIPEYEFFAALPSLKEIEKNKVVDFYGSYFEKGEKILQFIGGARDLDVGFINSLLLMFNERFRVLQSDFKMLKKFFRPMVIYADSVSSDALKDLVVMEFKGGEVFAIPASSMAVSSLIDVGSSGDSAKAALKKMKIQQMKGGREDEILSSIINAAKNEISLIKDFVEQKVSAENLDKRVFNVQALLGGDEEAVKMFPEEAKKLKAVVAQYKALSSKARGIMDTLNMIHPEYTVKVVEPSVLVDRAAKQHISLLESVVNFVMKRLYEKKLVK